MISVTKTGETTAFIKSRNLWGNFLYDQKEKTNTWISENRIKWTKLYEEQIKNKSVTKTNLEIHVLRRIEHLKQTLI